MAVAMMPTGEIGEGLEMVSRLTKDLRKAAREMPHSQARYMVDAYYAIQKLRIHAAGIVRSAEDDGEPHELLTFIAENYRRLEDDVKRVLNEVALASRPGEWMLSITGIGPVIAAGFLAHLDITRARYPGQFWRFAGLDPSLGWQSREKASKLVAEVVSGKKPTEAEAMEVAERVGRHLTLPLRDPKGNERPLTKANLSAWAARRPWNADLKVLCWKLGDSFVKQSGRDSDFYGKVYRKRKELEVYRNENGEFAETAAKILASKNFRGETIARAAYESGKLPPGHLDARARRVAVKLFLAHLHHVMHECHYGEPPPDTFARVHLGHTDYVPPPNW